MINDSSIFSNLDFELFVNDPKFDNDDNPYGKWVFHFYTNMENLNDTDKNKSISGYYDINVPLVPCNQDAETTVNWTSS